MTGLLKVAKTHNLLCDVICLLSYSHVADSQQQNIAKSAVYTELSDDLVGNIVYD